MGGIGAVLLGEGSVVASSDAAPLESGNPSPWWLLLGFAALVLLVRTRWHELGRGVRLGWRFSPPVGLAGALAMLVAGLIGGSIALEFTTGGISLRDTVWALGGLWIGWSLVVLALLVSKAIRPAARDSGAHRRATLGGACCMGVIGLLLFWPMTHAIVVLGAMVRGWVQGEPPDPVAHGVLEQLVSAGPSQWAWSLLLLVALIPPLLEEVLYRGLVQESLRRSSFGRAKGAWRCIILTSALFVFMHLGAVEVHALPGLFVLSLGFGWVQAQTGRLAAAVTMHMLFNIGNLLLAVPWITG
ncbi:MAG: CPBP family glutamic-type intramembrane protease [Phycisphaerales bacterium]|nr:CPBP family glutamic-type intramembrane protease [Phycisphaerales bacterium]